MGTETLQAADEYPVPRILYQLSGQNQSSNRPVCFLKTA